MFCSSTSTTEQYIFSLEYLHFCGGGGLDCPRPSIPSPTRKACTPLQPRRRGVRLKAHPCRGRLHNSTQDFPVHRDKERAASESTCASVHRETQQAHTKKQRTAFLHTITARQTCHPAQKQALTTLPTCVEHENSFNELGRDYHAVQICCTIDPLRCPRQRCRPRQSAAQTILPKLLTRPFQSSTLRPRNSSRSSLCKTTKYTGFVTGTVCKTR